MRIIYSFLIILTAVFLWLLPLSDMIYEFRTEAITDDETVTTGAASTTGNVTLDNFVYDDDDDTISVTSSINEVPEITSYNTTSKTVLVSSLTANTSRTLSVTYDVDAITDNDAVNNILDITPWIFYLIIIAWPVVSLAAIWTKE